MPLAYDVLPANRFRGAIQALNGITEKCMMGGVCFLLNGNMIGGADWPKDDEPGFISRLRKENQQAGLALMEMRQLRIACKNTGN